MTQEEKAQAYDEALNKAKIEINTKGIGETVNLCYQLFPQLAESEDENLKNKSGYYKAGKFWKASTLWNATKNKVPQRVPNRYIIQECTWNIGTLQRFADEVKNVQEVSLDYPIILDMNGNIIDGAHRVVKAYLEGKDIDIVYIGDDEWPEPDYDEEKAVRESKDDRIRKSLIKFLTDIKEISESGRTSWAVRKEDAEMCESFLVWLKKQKECVADNSKTSTDEDERIINQLITLVNSAGEVLLIPTNKEELVAWLNKCKESLHTPETCKENANSFTDGIIEVRSFQRGMEEGRRLERQKEQNGEDGFLEDELSAFLQNYDKEYDDDAAVSDVARHFYEIGKKQNEQKPHTDEEKEYIRTIKSIISDFIRDKKPENPAYYQRIYDWLDGRHVPFSCSHENGKLGEKQDYSELNDLERAILRGFLAAGVENVPIGIIKDTASECVGFLALTESEPVEWSEEDEGELQNAIDALEFLGKKGVYRSESGYDAALQAASWLKSLSERFNLQPKQKWSEEDEEMMADIIDSLEYAYPYDNEFRIAWLKSLRPQPKKELSIEKAIQWLDDTFYFLDNSSGRGRDCEIITHDFDSLEEMYDSFRKAVTVDSEPHWKPSEEQMKALQNAVALTACDKELARLYNQLKKL